MLSNKVYDTLKWITQFVLPGLATLYFALSGVWNLPLTEEIVGTIIAIDVFLGALLGISTIYYNRLKKSEGYLDSTIMDEGDEIPPSPFVLPGNVYDVLKWITLIFLPASATLYFALSQLWGFGYGEEVVGTVAAITAFMGLLLGLSTANFNKSLQ